MYAIGDTAFYGANGLCTIKDIREEKFNGQNQLYYILESTIYPSLTLYHPVNSEKSKLQKMISVDIAKKIIEVFKNPSSEWNERNAARTQKYKAIVKSVDHLEIAQFLNTLFRRQNELATQGKKLSSQDAQMVQQISPILFDELSLSLKIPKEKVVEKVHAIIAQHS